MSLYVILSYMLLRRNCHCSAVFCWQRLWTAGNAWEALLAHWLRLSVGVCSMRRLQQFLGHAQWICRPRFGHSPHLSGVWAHVLCPPPPVCSLPRLRLRQRGHRFMMAVTLQDHSSMNHNIQSRDINFQDSLGKGEGVILFGGGGGGLIARGEWQGAWAHHAYIGVVPRAHTPSFSGTVTVHSRGLGGLLSKTRNSQFHGS